MSQNRRLLFVAPSAYPLGGVASWLDYLLPGLEEKGWEPTLGLVGGRFHDPDRYLEEHPFHRVQRIHNPTGSHEGRIRALCKTIRAVDPALVLSVNIPDLFLAQDRLRRKGKSTARTVMTLHGIQSDLLGDAHAFRHFLDAVVCTNRLTCQLVEEVSGVPPDRIGYAPYGVDATPMPKREDRRPNDPVRIVWVGRLEETQKRVSDIPRILNQLEERQHPFELWLVGSGPDGNKLRRELACWHDEGRVKFFGEIPRERVCTEIYPEADLFLLTSSWETGPIVIWEAMSAGLPVVTSEYLGIGPEGSLFHGRNCLMFTVGDTQTAADCIIQLLSADKYEELVFNGLKLVQERYSTSVSVCQWDKVLKRTADRAEITDTAMDYLVTPSGRLDRWCGIWAAEHIRQLFAIHFSHKDAGGEWPHSIAGYAVNDFKFDSNSADSIMNSGILSK